MTPPVRWTRPPAPCRIVPAPAGPCSLFRSAPPVPERRPAAGAAAAGRDRIPWQVPGNGDARGVLLTAAEDSQRMDPLETAPRFAPSARAARRHRRSWLRKAGAGRRPGPRSWHRRIRAARRPGPRPSKEATRVYFAPGSFTLIGLRPGKSRCSSSYPPRPFPPPQVGQRETPRTFRPGPFLVRRTIRNERCRRPDSDPIARRTPCRQPRPDDLDLPIQALRRTENGLDVSPARGGGRCLGPV